MRRSLVLVLSALATLAAAAALASPASALNLSSTFNSGTEGWVSLSGDSVSHAPSSGNPGGGLLVQELSSDSSGVLDSPASWRGNALANYGGTIGFDLSTSEPPELSAGLEIYSGDTFLDSTAEERLYADLGPIPVTGSYNTYSTTLRPENFTFSFDGPNPSDAEFRQILKDFQGVVVYTSNALGAVPEQTGLDNIKLTGGALPVLAVTRALAIEGNKRTISGTMTSVNAACDTVGVPVEIVAKKGNKVVANTTVDAASNFKVKLKKAKKGKGKKAKKKNPKGKFFARAAAGPGGSDLYPANCSAATSNTVKLP